MTMSMNCQVGVDFGSGILWFTRRGGGSRARLLLRPSRAPNSWILLFWIRQNTIVQVCNPHVSCRHIFVSLGVTTWNNRSQIVELFVRARRASSGLFPSVAIFSLSLTCDRVNRLRCPAISWGRRVASGKCWNKEWNHPSILKEIYIHANLHAVSSKQAETQTEYVCVKQTFKPGARKGMENVRVRLAAFCRQVRPMSITYSGGGRGIAMKLCKGWGFRLVR
jgi:hypothetical protein